MAGTIKKIIRTQKYSKIVNRQIPIFVKNVINYLTILKIKIQFAKKLNSTFKNSVTKLIN